MTEIGIITLSIGKTNEQKGFYNTQEIGLAKVLADRSYKVTLYESDPLTFVPVQSKIKDSIDIIRIPCRHIKSHSFPDTKLLDQNIDILICFSDNQLGVPVLYKWCKRNGIIFCPYIGVTESHSVNPVKRRIMRFLYNRNILVYRKVTCLAKTGYIRDELIRQGIQKVEVLPPGLDKDLLCDEYNQADRNELRKERGYAPDDKIILFIGRMEEEKQPLLMIGIFEKLLDTDRRYRLIMIGHGNLSEQIDKEIGRLDISDRAERIERIPNDNIWKFYRLADCMVNLNKQEIFGMSILEAMYYECPVIAWHAPGPSLILRDHETGRIVDSMEGVIEAVEGCEDHTAAARADVIGKFLWNEAGTKIEHIIGNKSAVNK